MVLREGAKEMLRAKGVKRVKEIGGQLHFSFISYTLLAKSLSSGFMARSLCSTEHGDLL